MIGPTTKVPTALSENSLQIAPGPPERILFRGSRAIQRDPLEFLMCMHGQYGDLVRLRTGFWNSFLVYHPAHIKHILQSNARNYTYMHKVYKPFFGEGLLSSDGPTWLHYRRLIQTAFHRQRLATFAPRISEAAASLLEHWHGFAERGEPIDVAEEVTRLTQQIISRFLFGQDLPYNATASSSILSDAYKELAKSLWNPLIDRIVPLNVPILHHRPLLAARHMLDQMVQKMIAERGQPDEGEDKEDVLSILLRAHNETGQRLTTQHIRDQINTLFMAGYETTADLISWTLYLLAQHPEIAHRLQVELKTVLGGQLPGAEHLPYLSYTRMVLEESLRIYPPVWTTNRKAWEDDELGGYRIPRNSRIWVSPYVTHRHPAFWEQPEKFDPERFNPERSVERPHYAFFPFGGGPRQCIGKDFAFMEAQLIVATIAQCYRLHLIPGHPVEPEVLITLRPKHGLLMTLQPL